MIPEAFDYRRAASVDEALSLLASGGVALAGGHSLIPALKLRLSEPATLVDIARIPGLSGIRRRRRDAGDRRDHAPPRRRDVGGRGVARPRPRPGGSDGRRPAGAKPRHARRVARARGTARRPAGGDARARRRDRRAGAVRHAHASRPTTSSPTTTRRPSPRASSSPRSASPAPSRRAPTSSSTAGRWTGRSSALRCPGAQTAGGSGSRGSHRLRSEPAARRRRSPTAPRSPTPRCGQGRASTRRKGSTARPSTSGTSRRCWCAGRWSERPDETSADTVRPCATPR